MKLAPLIGLILLLVGCRPPGIDNHEHDRLQRTSTGTNAVAAATNAPAAPGMNLRIQGQ